MGDGAVRYDQVFQAVAMPLCVEDFSRVLEALARLRGDGVTDLRGHFEAHPDEVRRYAGMVRVVAVNEAAVTLHEASCADALLGGLDHAFPPETLPVFAALLADLADGKTTFRSEAKLLTKGGKPIEVLLQLSVPGQPPDFTSVVVVHQDISRRRAAELALEEANTFLDAIVENIPDMIFVKEAEELRFVRFNRAGEALLGIPRTQMYQKNDFDFFPREEAEFFTSKDRDVITSGRMVDIPEEPIHTTQGLRWLHTKKVPVYHPDGSPAFLLGISEDITELKRVREDLSRRTAELERSNRELEQFAYVASHDLHEPLRTIGSFVQLLADEIQGAPVSGDAREYMDVIEKAVGRMRALIQGLLEFSRVGRQVHNRVRVSSEQVLLEVLETLQVPIRESGTAVTHEPLPVVFVDRALFGRVFQNLIANAIKFRRDEVIQSIHISCADEGDHWRFSVRDEGIGFEQRFAEQIFGMFKRLHPVGRYPGAGIGLAICRRIIEDQGGRIWAESEPTAGSTFFFTVPKTEET